MEYEWKPVEGGPGDAGAPHGPGHEHGFEEWAELFARTIAHLAAQLTMTQLRLRALATTASEAGAVDPAAVQACLARLAEADTGRYLRENLGEALVEAIDVESLERDISAYLRGAGR